MRALAQRPCQSQDQGSDPKRSLVALSDRRGNGNPTPRWQTDRSNDTLTTAGHDFGRIPVHSRSPVRLQAKHTVNTPGDIHEQEADRVSEQVMRSPGAQPKGGCACGGSCSNCQGGGSEAVRAGSGGGGQLPVPRIVHEVTRSPGQPLEPAARSFMESRLGHDFGKVRVHKDEKAETSARAIDARAYTVGNHIVFGQRFDSNSSEGRRLLAHELTHVVQQSAGRVSGTAGSSFLQRKEEQQPQPTAPV